MAEGRRARRLTDEGAPAESPPPPPMPPTSPIDFTSPDRDLEERRRRWGEERARRELAAASEAQGEPPVPARKALSRS